MNIDYKGHTIVTGSECDSTSGRWNGRYRIMDDKGIVVYESFVEPMGNQARAEDAASAEARAWIDRAIA